MCVELLKRSKTCTRITLALFWQYINLFRGVALTSGFLHVHLFFVLVLAGKRISILQYNPSRGAELFDATLSNEAMHQRGKGGLINHLYLLHIHGDETVLWLPSFCLWGSCCFEFAWNIHYHELGTERAISLIQVCVCVCVCVCVELLKRSKTCTRITLALLWQYINLFRGVALTSGFLHVHLVFLFLCLLEKNFHIAIQS